MKVRCFPLSIGETLTNALNFDVSVIRRRIFSNLVVNPQPRAARSRSSRCADAWQSVRSYIDGHFLAVLSWQSGTPCTTSRPRVILLRTVMYRLHFKSQCGFGNDAEQTWMLPWQQIGGLLIFTHLKLAQTRRQNLPSCNTMRQSTVATAQCSCRGAFCGGWVGHVEVRAEEKNEG